MLEKRMVNRSAFKYNGTILQHPKSCGSKQMYESAHLTDACTNNGGSMKVVYWQKNELISKWKN